MKAYLSEKVSKVNSVAALKETVTELRKKFDRKILQNVRSKEAFSKLLEPIREKIKKLVHRGKATKKPAQKIKPESKLWKDLSGMSKQEVKEAVAEDFDSYMT